MKIVIADVETDGIKYTKIHCIAAALEGQEPKLFTDTSEFYRWCYDNGVAYGAYWVFHNGTNFDAHVINELGGGVKVDLDKVIDTQVLSKLKDYNKFNTHSLRELGEYLRVYKGDYTGGWDTYTTEMGEYCLQDVVVLSHIWSRMFRDMWFDPEWKDSIEVEHQIAYLCRDMEHGGFDFNKTKAEGILSEIKDDMAVLEKEFQTHFKPELVLSKTCKYRKKADGQLYANVISDLASYPKVEIREADGEYDCYEYKEFNPGSPRDRIDVLWDSGWKPFDKTKGHIKKLKEMRA